MYNNSFSRLLLLWSIEWKKRAAAILGFTVFSMLLMFGTMLLEAQRLRLSPAFFTMHFFVGVFVLVGIQMVTLFPEWRNVFQRSQYLQLPATTLEKYLSRLSFPLIIAPGIYSVAFLLCRPLCLQLSLAIKGFMPYPMYGYELSGLVLGSTLFSISLLALFVPGSIWINRASFIKSLLLYLAIFLGVALVSVILRLPINQITVVAGGKFERMLGVLLQNWDLLSFTYNWVWHFIILPIMLTTGYYLLKYREI